jgi:hypothetical protein
MSDAIEQCGQCFEFAPDEPQLGYFFTCPRCGQVWHYIWTGYVQKWVPVETTTRH